MDKQKIADRLIKARGDRNLSPEALSNRIGIHRNTMRNWEKNGTGLIEHLLIFKKICLTLNIKPEWVLGLEEKKSIDQENE